MNLRRIPGVIALALCAISFQNPTLAVTPEQLPAQEATQSQTVPEPVELALFGAALMAFAFRLRRKA